MKFAFLCRNESLRASNARIPCLAASRRIPAQPGLRHPQAVSRLVALAKAALLPTRLAWFCRMGAALLAFLEPIGQDFSAELM
jgi:hypothetical protein